MTASEKNFGRESHSFRKIGGQRSERREKQIAEAVAFESRALGEAVTEEFGKQGLIFAEGYDAVANVARR